MIDTDNLTNVEAIESVLNAIENLNTTLLVLDEEDPESVAGEIFAMLEEMTNDLNNADAMSDEDMELS